MKTTIKLLSMIAMTLLFAFTVQKLPDFSGDWKISNEESYFGEAVAETSAPAILKVKQANDEITIDRTFVGKPLMHEVFKMDGTVVSTKTDNGDTKEIHVKAEGDKLLVLSDFTTHQNDQDYAYSRKETWSLIDNGTLVMERVTWFTKGQDTRDSVRAVYHK